MANPVISARNVSKLYLLGERHPRYRTLRDTIAEGVARGLRGPAAAEEKSILWALKGVSFDVAQGEVLGVIGRNGAGKSTLLKILSEITCPTEGRVEIRGRVGSLLEVGTGFHPELTGRENIFLNGAILGMTRAEIIRKFDEIVAFAEIDRFIDTPVKRYSSGMYVRLAFAVAAHMEPEILLVDEVLAVGDVQFQKKCLGKMSEVAHEQGRTILFVSHNMAAIEALCSRCLLLHGGRLEAQGATDHVITQYQAAIQQHSTARVSLANHSGRSKMATPIMLEATLSDGQNNPTTSMRMGDDLCVSVHFRSPSKAFRPFLGVSIKSSIGAPVLSIDNRIVGGYRFSEAVNEGTITCHFSQPPLMPGRYSLDLWLGDEHKSEDSILDAIGFDVLPADVFGTGKLPPPTSGPVYWPARWSLQNADGAVVEPLSS